MHALLSRMTIVSALMMLTAVASAQTSRPPEADLIVFNAKVHTVDEANPTTTAFAVNDGKFMAVGSDADINAHRGANTKVIDAQGRTIIPGLNDSHAHAIRGGRFYNLELRWDGVESLERALQMISAQAQRTAMTEEARIEYLIQAIADLDDAVFLRNGREHTAAEAADHLRMKWESQRTNIKTVEQFIEHLASKSSISGRPYEIRFADGRVVTSAEFLRQPRARWVRVVGGWSPYQFKEKRMPTVAELNEAAPGTPVFVLYLYSQGFINQAAVKELGWDQSPPPNPDGGRYEWVDGGAILHAEPNPLILYQMIAQLPQLSEADQINSTLHFYREMNRLGLTSAVDCGGGGHAFPKDYTGSRRVAKDGEMSVRIGYYLFAQTAGKEAEDFLKWTQEYQAGRNEAENLEHGYELEGGGEFLAHSIGDWENFLAPQPRMEDRIAQGQDPKGDLHEVVTILVKNQWPLRQHATYGESIKHIMDVFEQVKREQGKFVPRWAIDHAETIQDAELQRIKAMGGGIAIQNRMAFAGEYFVDRYGSDAARYAPPVRRMIDMGIHVGAGTDGTRVSSYNPWLSLYWLVSGKTVGGMQLFADDNKLTREEALKLFTVGSAWFTQEENVKGAIKPGMFADFAVLSEDYFSVPEEQIKNIESVLTVVGGKVMYAAEPFDQLGEGLTPPQLPPVSPAWSPVAHFGGYQRPQHNNP